MSCDHNREKFFEIMAASGQVESGELERAFQGNRRTPGSEAERLAAEAKTRLLFDAISAQGLKPPTHSPSGLPRADAQPGYAAVYDLLRQRGLLGDTLLALKLQPPADPQFGPDGRDPAGFDRWGYNKEGLDRRGKDRQGFDSTGFDKHGHNRHGFDVQGYGRDGFNAAGYNAQSIGRDGLTLNGYDPQSGFDPQGFDRNSYDKDGYDRTGYNRYGLDRNGNPDPNFAPDPQGFYPDGFDAYGFARDGYDADGFDRYGFGRDGYNRAGIDRNANNRQGRPTRTDLQGYDPQGYKLGPIGYRRFDRAGYDEHGFDVKNISATGFDSQGNDKNGNPRMTLNPKGKPVPVKFRKDGFDDDGYDRWGFHRASGLSAPDASGRRINTFGWVYDEQTKECYDPADPSRRVRHRFAIQRIFIKGRRGAVPKATCEAYIPPAPPPPITPLAPMSEQDYDHTTARFDLPYELRHTYLSYDDIRQRPPTVNERRPNLHPHTCRNGVRLRCPHCGQFTGGRAHDCPAFGGETVFVYHSGLVQGTRRDAAILLAPLNPDFDARYDNNSGYDDSGFDRNGFDRYGYNQRGFDHEGYSKDGYDIFGYDRDGFDRYGYNNAGVNRHGERRERTLAGVSSLLERDEDLLANQDLARLYSQIATGLVGKPRRVVLKEGEGFATDMKGTIYADPYPLGRQADPRHNLVVTRAGIYHELGHEQFTPTAIWERVLAVHQGQQTEGLGEAGRAMLPRFYNIVEDGRMERQVAANYAGAAEILAASCRLEPRWGEQVGTSVPPDQEVFWALLYTGLPYYRVRSEVREAMSPRARALFEELEPLVSRAVHDSPEEAYRCAVHLARRFEEEGLIRLPPKEEDYSRELPGGGTLGDGQNPSGDPGGGNRSQSGADASSSDDESGKGRAGGSSQDDETGGAGRGAAAYDEPHKGHARGGSRDDDQTSPSARSSKDEEPTKDPSAPKTEQPENGNTAQRKNGTTAQRKNGTTEEPDNEYEWLFGNETVDAAMAAVERDAAAAIQAGVRARSRAENIGKPLHRPLPEQASVSQRYRGPDGMPVSVDVALPTDDAPHPELDARRERHRQVASLMAKPLRAIREQAEQRLRRLPQGKLDRRQLVNAYKGMGDIHTAVKERPQTSFAASIAVDMSGSMSGHIRSMELYDAVMVLGDTFNLLDMSHEVRAFGSSAAQVKAMDEPFAPKRAAYLASGNLGGTLFNDTAGLGHSSLLAREEKNRMMICLSDGAFSDHEESARSLRQARREGILTFGIFLGSGGDPARLDELYGKGNWTRIQTLSDMPKAVAQRLASIFKSMR